MVGLVRWHTVTEPAEPRATGRARAQPEKGEDHGGPDQQAGDHADPHGHAGSIRIRVRAPVRRATTQDATSDRRQFCRGPRMRLRGARTCLVAPAPWPTKPWLWSVRMQTAAGARWCLRRPSIPPAPRSTASSTALLPGASRSAARLVWQTRPLTSVDCHHEVDAARWHARRRCLSVHTSEEAPDAVPLLEVRIDHRVPAKSGSARNRSMSEERRRPRPFASFAAACI